MNSKITKNMCIKRALVVVVSESTIFCMVMKIVYPAMLKFPWRTYTQSSGSPGCLTGASSLTKKDLGAHGQHGAPGLGLAFSLKKRNFIFQGWGVRGARRGQGVNGMLGTLILQWLRNSLSKESVMKGVTRWAAVTVKGKRARVLVFGKPVGLVEL